jgi:hypothetical protein
MKRLRILIVEDQFLIAMALEATVAQFANATFPITTSVANTEKVLDQPLDFAFLDTGSGSAYAAGRGCRDPRP